LQVPDTARNKVIDAVQAIMQCPLKKAGTKLTSTERSQEMLLCYRPMKHNIKSKVFFHKRWYSGYADLPNGIEPEIYDALQHTTRLFQEAIDVDTAVQFTLHMPDQDLYSPMIFLVGQAKHLTGDDAPGLVFFVYEDGEEDHYYHGS
jgi:hypothetical protein